MSTRCYIGILQENLQDVRYVYCHYDGYVQHVGNVLINKYNTVKKINQLLSYGDMSSLDCSISDCCFYKRDRFFKGERIGLKFDSQLCSLNQFNKLDEILYLFKDNEWLSTDTRFKNKFISVEKLLIECMQKNNEYGSFVKMKVNKNICKKCENEKNCKLKFKSGLFDGCPRFLEHVTFKKE